MPIEISKWVDLTFLLFLKVIVSEKFWNMRAIYYK